MPRKRNRPSPRPSLSPTTVDTSLCQLAQQRRRRSQRVHTHYSGLKRSSHQHGRQCQSKQKTTSLGAPPHRIREINSDAFERRKKGVRNDFVKHYLRGSVSKPSSSNIRDNCVVRSKEQAVHRKSSKNKDGFKRTNRAYHRRFPPKKRGWPGLKSEKQSIFKQTVIGTCEFKTEPLVPLETFFTGLQTGVSLKVENETKRADIFPKKENSRINYIRSELKAGRDSAGLRRLIAARSRAKRYRNRNRKRRSLEQVKKNKAIAARKKKLRSNNEDELWEGLPFNLSMPRTRSLNSTPSESIPIVKREIKQEVLSAQNSMHNIVSVEPINTNGVGNSNVPETSVKTEQSSSEEYIGKLQKIIVITPQKEENPSEDDIRGATWAESGVFDKEDEGTENFTSLLEFIRHREKRRNACREDITNNDSSDDESEGPFFNSYINEATPESPYMKRNGNGHCACTDNFKERDVISNLMNSPIIKIKTESDGDPTGNHSMTEKEILSASVDNMNASKSESGMGISTCGKANKVLVEKCQTLDEICDTSFGTPNSQGVKLRRSNRRSSRKIFSDMTCDSKRTRGSRKGESSFEEKNTLSKPIELASIKKENPEEPLHEVSPGTTEAEGSTDGVLGRCNILGSLLNIHDKGRKRRSKKLKSTADHVESKTECGKQVGSTEEREDLDLASSKTKSKISGDVSYALTGVKHDILPTRLKKESSLILFGSQIQSAATNSVKSKRRHGNCKFRNEKSSSSMASHVVENETFVAMNPQQGHIAPNNTLDVTTFEYNSSCKHSLKCHQIPTGSLDIGNSTSTEESKRARKTIKSNPKAPRKVDTMSSEKAKTPPKRGSAISGEDKQKVPILKIKLKWQTSKTTSLKVTQEKSGTKAKDEGNKLSNDLSHSQSLETFSPRFPGEKVNEKKRYTSGQSTESSDSRATKVPSKSPRKKPGTPKISKSPYQTSKMQREKSAPLLKRAKQTYLKNPDQRISCNRQQNKKRREKATTDNRDEKMKSNKTTTSKEMVRTDVRNMKAQLSERRRSENQKSEAAKNKLQSDSLNDTGELYGNSRPHTRTKSLEDVDSLLGGLPGPRIRRKKEVGPSQTELFKDVRLGIHACSLWSSENRRHFQFTHPDLSSSDLDSLMRAYWEDLGKKEKMQYYKRAFTATTDKQKSKKEPKKSKSESVVSTKEPKDDNFYDMHPSQQETFLKQRLCCFENHLSSYHYDLFLHDYISSFKSSVDNIKFRKGRQKNSTLADAHLDTDNTYLDKVARRLLYSKIKDLEPFVNEVRQHRKFIQYKRDQHRLDDLVWKLIEEEPVAFDDNCRSEQLSELMDAIINVENRPSKEGFGRKVIRGDEGDCGVQVRCSCSNHDEEAAVQNIQSQLQVNGSSNPTDFIINHVSHQVPDLAIDDSFTTELLKCAGQMHSLPDLNEVLQEYLESAADDTGPTEVEVSTNVHQVEAQGPMEEARDAIYRHMNGLESCCELESPSCVLSYLMVDEMLETNKV